MKNLLKNIKNKRPILLPLLFIQLLCFDAFANIIKRQIVNVSGEVIIKYKKNIRWAKSGDIVNDLEEVITSTSSYVNFSDLNKNIIFQLAEDGHVQIFNEMIELKRGNLLIKSSLVNDYNYIITANSKITHERGEAIVTYSIDGRTQLLVIDGNFSLANRAMENTSIQIMPMEFSFVQTNHDDGIPREGTRVGASSYQKLLGIFNNEEINKVNSNDSKPKITILEKNKKHIDESSIKKLYEQETQKLIKKKHRPKEAVISNEISNVTIEIYGAHNKIKKKAKKDFKPIPQINRKVHKNIEIDSSKNGQNNHKLEKNNNIYGDMTENLETFDKSLEKEYRRQSRHPKELNSLIQNLKSFDQDYDQSHEKN